MGCNDLPHTHGHTWAEQAALMPGSPTRYQCTACGRWFHEEMERMARRCEEIGFHADAVALRQITEPSRFKEYADRLADDAGPHDGLL